MSVITPRRDPLSMQTAGPRILFLPFYEDLPSLRARTLAGVRQRRQKRGLREALERQGPLLELDFRRVAKRGRHRLACAVEDAVRSMSVDLIVSELHDRREIEARDVDTLRRRFPDTRWVNWNGDYRSPDTWQRDDVQLLSCFDLNLTPCMDAVHALTARGIAAAYWQSGCEPDSVGSTSAPDNPSRDIVLLANCYSASRRALGEALRATGAKVEIYGSGWPTGWARRSTLYDYAHGREIIRSARLVIGDSQWPEADGFVSDRWFQSFAAGGAMVLHQYFKGYERLGFVAEHHLVLWRDRDDLRSQIDRWLSPDRDHTRIQIAERGHDYCVTAHSFDVRVADLLRMLPIRAAAGR